MTIKAHPRRDCPVPLVCPACRGALSWNGDGIACAQCDARFVYNGGFPDLIVGERFDDDSDDELLLYEERSNAHLTESYWLPLFRKLWPGQGKVRILSCGCGIGIDVDLLTEQGFECVGIDCGNRTRAWHRRSHPESLVLANGKRLPFGDASFDGAYCGCVFPHVGVEGDTNRVQPDYHESRLALAREMSRVVRPGGRMVVASPNRLFPFDIFHGRQPGSYKPRMNWPGSPFLLSLDDYRRLFLESGCARVDSLPVDGYWGFVRSRNSIKGLLLGAPVQFVFWLVSKEAFKFLRNSPINPWLVVLVER